MNLLELQISNYKRIKAVRIRPDGSVVTITGRNLQGKSSAIHAIWTLLKGQSETPPRVIRDGEEECVIKGVFGDKRPSLTVTRTFTRQEGGDITMTLRIVQADGTPITKKQQGFIDALLPKGSVSFDPLSFARLSDSVAGRREQYDILRRLIPGIDFDALAAQRKTAFEARAVANKQRDDAKMLADRVELPAGTCPPAVDVAAKIREVAEAGAKNAAADRSFEAIRARHDMLAAVRAKIASMREEANRLEMQSNDEAEELGEMPARPEPVDTAAIQAEIAGAQRIDNIRSLFAKRDEHEAAARRYAEEAERLDGTIKVLDKKKSSAIEGAKLPVPGLGLGDGEVMLNGLPFSQAGTSEKIKVAVSIQMALNPDLKVMTIDEGAELDSASMEWLAEVSEAHGYTIVIVRVDESGEGIVIENGEVKS